MRVHNIFNPKYVKYVTVKNWIYCYAHLFQSRRISSRDVFKMYIVCAMKWLERLIFKTNLFWSVFLLVFVVAVEAIFGNLAGSTKRSCFMSKLTLFFACELKFVEYDSNNV